MFQQFFARSFNSTFTKLTVAAALAVVSLGSAALADNAPRKVPALFNKIFAPGGFDSNDNVQIVGEGRFRNTCYRHAETTVSVDKVNKKITLGPVAYEYSGMCIQVILPFQRVIDVGILEPGKWEVVQGDTGHEQSLGSLAIQIATRATADDFLYAPISQAFFRQQGLNGEIVLTGDFPNSCMMLDDVKVTLESDVIVVQPIAKMLEGPDCKDGKVTFTRVVNVDLIPKGRYLLHVRSMNGNAINSLVDMN